MQKKICALINKTFGEKSLFAISELNNLATRYIANENYKKAFELLHDAGFDSHGVTSPWHFGEEVENTLLDYLEYRKSITPIAGHENALFYSVVCAK